LKQVTNNCINPVKPNNTPVVVIKNEADHFSGFVGLLDASETSDQNNDILTYEWTVPNNVSVSSTTGSKIRFLAPLVNTSRIIEFQLKVSDGIAIVTKSIPINIMPYKPELSSGRITNIKASSYETTDYPENVLDGNLLTKWSATGDNHWLLFKLAEPFKINHFEISFLKGQKYYSYFDIYASTDNVIWDPILTDAVSCDFSGDSQVFDFPPETVNTGYKYAKIIVHGNSLDFLNNISELKIYGLPQPAPVIGNKDEGKITIYPNPAIDYINISIDAPVIKPDRIRILDLSGMVIYQESFELNFKGIQIPSSLRSGIYIVELKTGLITLYTGKFIVKR
jgi:hypothetical protein